MRAKEYLMQIWNIDKDIQSRIDERSNILHTQLSGIDYSKDNVQESQKVYDDKYMKYIELKNEIDKKLDELIDLKRKISNEIDQLEDRLSIILLRQRYINMKSWSEIQAFLGYEDLRHVYKLHLNALNQFDEYLALKQH